MFTSRYNLFIHLRYQQGVSADEGQQALYLHKSDEEGGTLNQIETTETGRVANHRRVEDVFQDHGELRAIGYVPFWKLKHMDGIIRCLDNGLDYLKKKTSLKWELIMAVQLMEENIIKTQKIKHFRQEMLD